MLRDLLGDVNFKKGIQSYYKKYFNANATTADFRFEMEQASGLDLQSFFTQWLYQEGLPNIKGQWSWDSKKKELKITLEQTQASAFSFPLEIGIVSDGKQSPQIKKANISSKQSTFTFVLESRPTSLTLDPRTNLLGVFDIQAK
ncbi:MAG: M1 family aminopeptidase [Cyclobacteriaceae bacterium]